MFSNLLKMYKSLETTMFSSLGNREGESKLFVEFTDTLLNAPKLPLSYDGEDIDEFFNGVWLPIAREFWTEEQIEKVQKIYDHHHLKENQKAKEEILIATLKKGVRNEQEN